MAIPQEEFTLDHDSVKNIVGNTTKQVMVYGFGHAKYIQVRDSLKEKNSPIQKVFDHSIGDPNADIQAATTLEGSLIDTLPLEKPHDLQDVVPFALPPSSGPHDKKLKSPIQRQVARECKAGITNLVLENYKRSQQGLSPIPVIFCLESSDTIAKEKGSSSSLASKDNALNALITHSELRRVYKLCRELETSPDPELQALSRIAKETFKFVKVERVSGNTHQLTPMTPAWEDQGWTQEWDKRLQTDAQVRQENRDLKQNKWREQLRDKVRHFNAGRE